MLRNEDRNQEILSALRQNNSSLVAKQFGISRQRVNQIIDLYGGRTDDMVFRLRTSTETRALIEARLRNGEKHANIAKALGVGCCTVSNHRNRLGIPRYLKPIGCPDCKKKAYAKGLCKNCYMRNWHREKS